MSKIQEELSRIQKELKAPKSNYNSFGKYAYRSAEDIMSAAKPVLGECALLVSDSLVDLSTGVYVEATASLLLGGEILSANGYAKEAIEQKGMSPAQITGSTSSFARKYALNGLFAIDDTKDDDATNTHGKGEKPSQPPAPAPSKITPEQTIEITNLIPKAGLTAEEEEMAKAFAKSDKTTEENAKKFIAKLKERIASKANTTKKTPKELLIDDVIATAMAEWKQDEDFAVLKLITHAKVISMSKISVEDLKKLKAGILDGSVTPF